MTIQEKIAELKANTEKLIEESLKMIEESRKILNVL